MKVPEHIGIIPDGNRRWARKKGLPPYMGHFYGAKKIEEILSYLLEIGVKKVSIYALSLENLINRSEKEKRGLFKILRQYLKRWLNGEYKELELYEVKINFCGNLISLPKSLTKLMSKIVRKTSKYNKRILNILIAYSGTYEILKAMREIAKRKIKIEKINEDELRKYLLVKDNVDLIIRSGGYSRLSNFLPFQSTYAEIYVTKKLWPEINKRDILDAIKWFNKIQRNFGK
ncbi:MAG: polyprenyl diphosphate synthase [Candidatus Aenigmatarchaeota archaeon]